MTDQEFADIRTYIRSTADTLALKDWRIDVAPDPSHHDASAEIVVNEGKKWATIYLCWNFRGLDPEMQRKVIIHELLHCHYAGLQHMIDVDAKKYMALSDNEHSILRVTFMRTLEYSVDGVADGIAWSFPFISWSTEEVPA